MPSATIKLFLVNGEPKRLRYGARGDLKNKNGETAAEIMSRKRDPEFKSMFKNLLTRR